SEGVELPFAVRMGVNTGYCNVGNFGSEDRMDYTIIGAEANLAARLQGIAQPGTIVVSYETYALVRERYGAHPLPPMHVKGINREVRPYVIEAAGGPCDVFSQRGAGIDFYLDVGMLDERGAERARDVLRRALGALEATPPPSP
ncbi:MAG: adenylate/guanylate cyclase domain-containing protein, partial [Candidatus Eremiobacteraeota bacterium]|nr:adenylate/guanylate cyclase domain-containing protein [Candidatus Eremiobacteraeota bacterium]